MKETSQEIKGHSGYQADKISNLIEKIQRTERINLNFKENMQTRIGARDQLRELYKQVSADSNMMDRLKQEDPKMLERLQDRFECRHSRSQGLEI